MEITSVDGWQHGEPQRDEGGWLLLEEYGALGDGRSVALIGLDGSIDWWCVPHMDSPPLFDRLLAPHSGGFFSITPCENYRAERRYLPDSNVLETLFVTPNGRARLTESLNSGPAGRLPWAELARRIEGIEGQVDFNIAIDFGTQADTVSPYLAPNDNGCVFHAGHILGMFIHDAQVRIDRKDDWASGHSSALAKDKEPYWLSSRDGMSRWCFPRSNSSTNVSMAPTVSGSNGRKA